MIYSESCHSCGHTKSAYVYSLNLQLTTSLSKLVNKYLLTLKPYGINELGLTTSQHSSFAKLQYFGLAQRVHGENKWVPTDEGIAFSVGFGFAYNRVIVFDNVALGYNDEMWERSEKQPRLITVNQVKGWNQEGREDYLAQ